MTILVVAAHPDDEVLGCGGTIARSVREGADVFIAILGEGVTSRYSNREEADQRLVETLHGQCEEAARILGAKALFTYKLPDNRFDTLPLLDIIKIIEELIDRLHPSAIYTHYDGDLNVDHCLVNRAVLTATRPTEGCPVEDVFAFEVPSSTEWAFSRGTDSFRPNVFVDVRDTLGEKIRAMQTYTGEVREFPHPRSEEALRAIATRWGSTVGVHSAEAFELVRSIVRRPNGSDIQEN